MTLSGPCSMVSYGLSIKNPSNTSVSVHVFSCRSTRWPSYEPTHLYMTICIYRHIILYRCISCRFLDYISYLFIKIIPSLMVKTCEPPHRCFGYIHKYISIITYQTEQNKQT